MMPARIAAALAAALALGCGAASAEPAKIRADWSSSPGQTTPVIPHVPKHGPDVYRHFGKSYTVETTFIAGGGRSLTALAAGQIDLAAFTAQTLTHAVTQAKLEVRVIGQQVSSEVPGYASNAFWVRKAEIERIEDLKGKTIAVNARGSTPDATARIVLGRAGLQDGKDFTIVELRFPAMLEALRSRKVDAAFLLVPFSLAAEKNPALKRLFSGADAFGTTETVLWVVRADYLAGHRAVLVDFLEDNMRFRRWATDPRTRPLAVKVLAEVSKQPEENFAEWVYTNKDFYRDPHCLVNLDRLQKNIDDMKAAGIVADAIRVGPYADISLAKEAAARLN